MTAKPRRNEDRFYRYPKQRIVAVLRDAAQVDAVLGELAGTHP